MLLTTTPTYTADLLPNPDTLRAAIDDADERRRLLRRLLRLTLQN